MKKIHTYRFSLKYKKINMQICQLWSVVNFFLLKINRSLNSRFSTSFFSGETENTINFDINTEKQSQFEQF
jgi:hypothetical protein